MRYSIPAAIMALILATGPAAAFGGAVSFPTLTWPVTTAGPATTPAPVDPLTDCTGPGVTDPTLCPAPSR